MAHRKVEEEIERLKLVRDWAPAEAEAALRKALADRVNLMVAKAAALAAELGRQDLIPDLLRAFDRLFEKPRERDPQCWGKNAIAKALAALEYREAAPYLRGVRHIQMEPVWGGEEDTAPTLRGTCALALPACVDIDRGEVLRCLVDALGDPAGPVRSDAIRGIARMEGESAELLLRMKARTGDSEASIVGEVFDWLLTIERDRALSFVADFLQPKLGLVGEEAALAMGSSRLRGAVRLLMEAWEAQRDPDYRLVLLRALSATREPEALEFLLNLIRNGRAIDASSAIEALSLHKGSDEIRRQTEEAVRERDPELQRRTREAFAGAERA